VAVRVPNWESKLADFVESKSNEPFKWGVHDCATFACKCVEVITGVYPIKDRWKSKAKAVRMLKERSIIDRTSDVLEEIDVNLAKRGDVVATMTEDGIALGIFMSPVAVFASKSGTSIRRRHELLRAWKV
jgi:hypothetical protein